MSIDQAGRASRPPVGRLRSGLALLGPAFVAAIAYVDPGNVATNTSAGAQYGYLLVWVLVVANVMAGLVQYLSAKLGLVTGRSLPEVLRTTLRRPARLAYWAQAEVVAMATDLAEVLGGAIALYLLFDLPLLVGGLITGLVSTGLLLVQDRRGQRPFERVVTGLLLVIAIGFAAGLLVAPPAPGEALAGLLPAFAGSDSLLLATGMLGATVMPHAVYLHSALARDRHGQPAEGPARDRLLTATRFDVGTAMLLAGAVNMAMLLLAASGLRGVPGAGDDLVGVHAAIEHTLGWGVALLFAIGLLASGFASTSVGCYAGAVVMAGLLRVRVPLLVRRLLTLLPALVVLALGVDPTWSLVLSQVVLSFGIPFALVPLVVLTARRDLMGSAVNHRATTVAAVLVAGAVTLLNLTLVYLTLAG
ncbi:Nramp family divalent metal transporter [Goodfellowiella coeruleoviolacea]|uniref:Manganese transport protein n=1 Tax=Goodfellowiella coeruleoviolacea TaxID=334858 RepID=A0AAE3GKI6_9PSEU|nr:Nramp family divalent metal transporter [Goodfellowiella coeruleoviolacea]MCP2169293.1 manganese transport protein [Goodfellowiella coeruleoviolacea]